MADRRISWFALFGLLAAASVAPASTAASMQESGDERVAPAEPEDAEEPDFEPGTKVKRDGIEWLVGPATGKLGDMADLQLPASTVFTPKPGAQKFIRDSGNLASGSELGIVVATGEDGSWWACFEFDASGFIKDDEKDELDPDALLEVRKEGAEQANDERKRRGLEPLSIVGWSVEPHYDDKTHNLEYGLLIQGATGQSINYRVALLGRSGKMDVDLICGPDDFETALPQFRELIAGYAFVDGQRYDQWTQGDPVSEIGLTALVAGGAGVALWKTGLIGKLAKFAKFIAIAVIAAVVGIWRKLTGKGSAAQPQQ